MPQNRSSGVPIRLAACAALLAAAAAVLAQPPGPKPRPVEPGPLPTPVPGPPQFYPPPGPAAYPIDLPTALRLVDTNNPTVGIARARVREATAQLDRARVAWVPNLTFGPAFFYHAGIDQNRRGDIFSVARGNFTLGAGPTLRVDLADALYLPLVARQVVRASESRSQAVTNTMQLAAAVAYLDLLELHALLAINADTLAKAEQVLRAAEGGVKAGLNKTAADVNRAATEVELRRQEAIVLRGRAGAAAARLTQVLQLDPMVELTPFEVAVVPVVLVPAELTMRDLIATAQLSRPEVEQAEAELRAAGGLLRQARVAPFLPRIQADFIGGGLSGGINDNFGPMRGQLNAGAALAWDLDNFGLGNAAVARARQANQDAVALRVAEVRAQVSAEVTESGRLAAARFDTLTAAQEAVRQAQEMYRKFRDTSFGMVGPKGQFDALEPLTAIQALNQAQVQYLQQVVEFNRAQFRLFTAIGQPAVCGLDAAVPQPLSVPVVPPRPAEPAKP